MASPLQKLVLIMKTTLVIACLLGLSFGISGIPANAFDISFGNYDHNRDGRWDRDEYYDANRDWHSHNDQKYLERKEAYRRFDNYDRDHDGYLNDHEVRDIDAW